MRTKRPRRASLDEVRITRDGDTAIIEHADPTVSVAQVRIGPGIKAMSDAAVLDLFNSLIAAQEQIAAAYDNTVVEIPPGQPQIKFVEGSQQWVPRGQVLRCQIADDKHGELVIHVDDQELELAEFGRMLRTYAGWGMRITFVPDGRLADEPDIEVRNPRDDDE